MQTTNSLPNVETRRGIYLITGVDRTNLDIQNLPTPHELPAHSDTHKSIELHVPLTTHIKSPVASTRTSPSPIHHITTLTAYHSIVVKPVSLRAISTCKGVVHLICNIIPKSEFHCLPFMIQSKEYESQAHLYDTKLKLNENSVVTEYLNLHEISLTRTPSHPSLKDNKRPYPQFIHKYLVWHSFSHGNNQDYVQDKCYYTEARDFCLHVKW